MTLAEQRPICFTRDMFGSQKPSTSSYNPHELLGKRHGEDDSDAPRAKRRFERVSAQFERFSISEEGERNGRLSMDTSDSDDSDAVNNKLSDDDAEGLVEEPDENANGGLLLNDYLKDYLQRMKQDDFGLPAR
ncbi:unnamed protein product [Cylicostephanus goldi]|uniref:Uncharacterized protein n=1 Tax=Cylicostephanus goldi TaxID=71465 RepID=A0A3P6SFM5_CYLGO|nr:unnamed protein product [Cylicostephanus goldi]